jgi:hypothetical protein
MGIRYFRTQQIFVVTFFLFLIFLVAFPGTGQAVKPMDPPLHVPKAFGELGTSVVGLRFYASQSNKVVPIQARKYSASFNKDDNPYIWWELCLNNKVKLNHPVTLDIWITWQRPDKTEFYQSVAATIPGNLQQPCMSAGEQDKKGWVPGSYRVSIQIDDLEVASGSFEIFQKFLK